MIVRGRKWWRLARRIVGDNPDFLRLILAITRVPQTFDFRTLLVRPAETLDYYFQSGKSSQNHSLVMGINPPISGVVSDCQNYRNSAYFSHRVYLPSTVGIGVLRGYHRYPLCGEGDFT